MQNAKAQSRGSSCDMSTDAVLCRLNIVDELRELAKDLQNAKRLGPLNSELISTSALSASSSSRLNGTGERSGPT